MSKKYSIAFLVLLYNKEISESETLTSFNSLNLQNEQALLLIWNNGPNSISEKNVRNFDKKELTVNIIETIGNESLSKIYNQFINDVDANKYVILDDDSSLNQNFLNAAIELTDGEIGVPLIYSNQKLTGPKLNRKLCSIDDSISNKDKFFGIGSGLVIGRRIVNQMEIDYNRVFDDRFYFYGVDSTFFFRLKQSNLNNYIKIIPGFEHSLSKLKKEAEPISEFRLKEMSYDIGLRLRYYKPMFTGIFLMIKESLTNGIKKLQHKKQKVSVRHLIRAFFIGKHYRQ